MATQTTQDKYLVSKADELVTALRQLRKIAASIDLNRIKGARNEEAYKKFCRKVAETVATLDNEANKFFH